MNVAVVVLGDIARSPRTLYHARAFAAHGADVDLLGYVESALPAAVTAEPRITVHGIRDVAAATRSRSWSLTAALWRGLTTSARLAWLLCWRIPRPEVILVQNPPGVPVLFVAWAASRLRSARFAIDWHNLTHSMLAVRLGESHWLVRLVAWHEQALGRRADLHLFVSTAMQRSLAARWGLAGTVFRDRPADAFTAVSDADRSRIRRDIGQRLGLPDSECPPAMAVSPTSWTADEDFDLLLDGLERCDALIREWEASANEFPNLLILLTGKGPLRAHYEQRIATRPPTRIHVRTLWLESDEYPQVLAAADLGLCLHRSSSGLDLPMKIADMFGAGIPVCALDYGPCLAEIVHDGRNGILFTSAEGLARQLFELFNDASGTGSALRSLRDGVALSDDERWPVAWQGEVWPLLRPTRNDDDRGAR